MGPPNWTTKLSTIARRSAPRTIVNKRRQRRQSTGREGRDNLARRLAVIEDRAMESLTESFSPPSPGFSDCNENDAEDMEMRDI
jgi:hypothetical protein